MREDCVGTLISGSITCTCGWESGYYPLAQDAINEFENHEPVKVAV